MAYHDSTAGEEELERNTTTHSRLKELWQGAENDDYNDNNNDNDNSDDNNNNNNSNNNRDDNNNSYTAQ